jgi:chromosome segregation ATPase
MASESGENTGTDISVPAELSEWLDEQAGVLDVGRAELLTQILSSYRATAELDEASDRDAVADVTVDELIDVDDVIQDAVDDAVEEVAAATATDVLEDRAPELIEAAVTEAVEDALERDIADRIEAVETEFQSKITDVRERVIQVKRETDEKAPADHSHPELDAMSDLEERLDSLQSDLSSVEATVEERTETVESMSADVERVDADLAEATENLDDVSSKLNRVAWVVSDLKDDVKSRDKYAEAVDRIKRAAAKEGLTEAACESCNEQVDVSLLTEPECPHCNATVSDVRPDGGIFRKKGRLVTAAQLEAGPEDDDQ